MPYEFIDDAPAPSSRYEFIDEPAPRTFMQEVERQGNLTGRAVAEGMAAIPLAAADFGVGARNLITGSDYESPSSMFSGLLDRTYGKRETGLEEAVGIAGSALAGSKIPVPTVKGAAPDGYRSVEQLKKAAMAAKVKAAQQAGYVVPPTTSNPTAVNKVLEGISGKLATAQHASLKNADTTSRLASKGLGLSEDVPISIEAVQALRAEAGAAYDVVRKAGTVELGDKFGAAVDKALAVAKGANKSFPGLADSPAMAKIEALRKPSAEASDIVDAIKIVRDLSDEGYRGGARYIGKAYKEVASALERALDDKLVKLGDVGAIKAFRNARTLIAKSHTIEGAMRKSGNVAPAKLASDLAKGKPLTGEIRQIAEFGRDFPKAARTLNESFPGMSPLDAYAAMGTAGISKNPLYLGLPFVRLAARNALLSPFGQRLAVPSQGGPINPELAAGLATGVGQLRQ
jgi:hypothetical protein